MKCETCGHDMHWQGSLRDGHLACEWCESQPTVQAAIDAARDANSVYQQLKDQFKQLGQPIDQPAAQPDVKSLVCVLCGKHSSCFSSVEHNRLRCPYCNAPGALKEEP